MFSEKRKITNSKTSSFKTEISFAAPRPLRISDKLKILNYFMKIPIATNNIRYIPIPI